MPERSNLYLATTTSRLDDIPEMANGLVLSLSASSISGPGLEAQSNEDRSPSYGITDSKKGHISFIEKVLPRAVQFAAMSRQASVPLVIRDEDGRNLSVAVAMVILWLFYDDNGKLRSGTAPIGQPVLVLMRLAHAYLRAATKEGIRTRLHWVIQRRPGSNPSRTMLKWVNEFLMSPARPKETG